MLPTIGRGDDGDIGAEVVLAQPPAAVEAEVAVVTGADAAATDDQPAKEKEPAVAADAAEAKPDEPQPVGKLQIRKGTGRPPGMPANAGRARAVAAPVEVGEIVGLMPDAVPKQADEQELEREIEEHRQRILTQLRPLLHRELYFVHLVCDTTAEERQQLLTVGESELMKLATAAAQRAGQQVPAVANDFLAAGMIMDMPAAPAAPEAEANKKLQTSLLQTAETTLGEQRAARLRTELEERTAAQRRGPVDHIISQLDAFLVLSAQQQVELRDTLLASWREEWKTVSQVVDARYFPNVQLPPAALSTLSNDQRNRFSAIPKVSFQVHQHPVEVDPAEGKPDRWKEALEQLDRAEQTRGENR